MKQLKTHKSTYKKFKSKAQALAFIAGIEFVNDSDIEVWYMGKHLGGYIVQINERREVFE